MILGDFRRPQLASTSVNVCMTHLLRLLPAAPNLQSTWWFLPPLWSRCSPHMIQTGALHSSLQKHVVYSAQREVTNRNHYKSLCNNLWIIYMQDVDLFRCFYFHEQNMLPFVCINDCLLDTNPFNWSKNTSWIKTQVIRTKKLEMTTPGADGLMAWASNGIPPPKYNYMQNPTWRNTEDLTLNYRRQNVQNWGSEVTRHVLPWLEDALELFSPPGAGDVCNLNHKVQEKWGQKKHIGHFSAMSLLSAEGNLLTLWNMFRNKVFWFRK